MSLRVEAFMVGRSITVSGVLGELVTIFVDAETDDAVHPATVKTIAIAIVMNFLIGDLPFLIEVS